MESMLSGIVLRLAIPVNLTEILIGCKLASKARWGRSHQSGRVAQMGCWLAFHLNPEFLAVADQFNPSVQIGAQYGNRV